MRKRVLFTLIFVALTSLQTKFILAESKQANPIIDRNFSSDEFIQTDIPNLHPLNRPTNEIRPIAEFEQMEGVLIRYPLGIPISFVALMSLDTKVYTLVTEWHREECVAEFQSHNVNMNNIEFIYAETDTYWVTDYGPWFIAHNDQIEIVDYPYNRPRPLDNVIPIIIASYWGVDYYYMNVEHNGGNFMCDGNSIGASTYLVYEENTNLSHTQIANYFNDYLGIETYHVTIDPPGEYIKHINCWGKFLDVDKILIGQVPVSDPRHDDFEFVANYFAAQTSAWGNNYQVFRVYCPEGYLATPYANSLILNKRVYVPSTGSQWDDEAVATYESAMPGYEIIPIYSDDWLNTDALRCRTYGMADRNMLYVEHFPILGEQEYQEEYEINAKIVSYSSSYIYPDSLLVYYKVNGGDFSFVNLLPLGGSLYAAIIPGQPPGSSVQYYLHAADSSGKSVDHPLIGAYDPHDFTVAALPQPAELVVDPLEVNIELSQNQATEFLLELSNIGDLPLFYTLNELVEWLSLNPLSGTINGGDSVSISMTFDSTGLLSGEYTCSLIICDDREETTVPVTLIVTALEGDNTIEKSVFFIDCYPNPFNPSTTIEFSLNTETAENTELTIYNFKGQKVRQLVSGQLSAGQHSVVWNGEDDFGKPVSSGIYFYKLKSGDFEKTKKMLLIK